MAPTRRPRIFLDSNVIVSGLNSPAGPPGGILRRLTDGDLVVVVSPFVLDEVVRNMNEKFPRALPDLRALLVSATLEIVEDPSPTDVARWTPYLHLGDAAILAAVVAAQPDYLVTGDKDFPDNPAVSEKSGLRIVSPSQFLASLESAEPSHTEGV